jgi:hypothetical protein
MIKQKTNCMCDKCETMEVCLCAACKHEKICACEECKFKTAKIPSDIIGKSLFKIIFNDLWTLFMWSTHEKILHDMSKIYDDMSEPINAVPYKSIEFICSFSDIKDPLRDNKI